MKLPLTPAQVAYIAISLVALAIFAIASQLEAFEHFYRFSRLHEDWELDEAFSFFIVASFAFAAISVVRSRQLSLALRLRHAAEAHAQEIARHDPLTGLPNRRALRLHFETLARAAGSSNDDTIFMLIDLDRFKPVNDLHGHACGDTILQMVADRIGGSLDEGDLVARLGGDEFAVVLLAGTGFERAGRVARRIVAGIEDSPFVLGEVVVRIGASVGVAVCPANDGLDVALRSADQALYHAKRSGRGQVAWYDEDLDKQSVERAGIEASLRAALHDRLIVPHFQPIVDLDSGRIEGFEVLARWTDPVRGAVSPEVFIPIAEDAGIISQLGWCILRQACELAKDWPEELKLAVNVSPQQFGDGMLVETLKQVLRETGFAPARL